MTLPERWSRDPPYGHAPGHSRVTDSRHQAALGGHGRTATKTVRDREDEGSNPSPPTIFVFEIVDFGGCLQSAGHRRVTISCEAFKLRPCNGACRGAM